MKNKAFGIWLAIVVIVIGVVFYLNPGILSSTSTQSNTARTAAVQPATSSGKTPDNGKKILPDKQSGKIYNVSELSSDMTGQTITLICKVDNINERKDNVFFTVHDIKTSATIKGVMFRNTNLKKEARKDLLEECAANGSSVFIDGQVDVYKGQLEIKAWKVYTL